MIAGVQILGVIFGLGLFYLAFLSFKRQEFTPIEWGFWTVLSVIVILMSLFPQVLDPVVTRLKFARALDLYVILGFMFLLLSLFYTYTISRRTQVRVEELVRKMAINETLRKRRK
ncbi:MAG: DUF2304 domain-containing protein [Nanoarchaeota archaeon]